jgi:hypothetical protein
MNAHCVCQWRMLAQFVCALRAVQTVCGVGYAGTPLMYCLAVLCCAEQVYCQSLMMPRSYVPPPYVTLRKFLGLACVYQLPPC